MITLAVHHQGDWRGRLALLGLGLFALVGVSFFVSGIADQRQFGCWNYGGDFIQFYTSGRLVLQGEGANMYDQSLQAEAQRRVAIEAGSECYSVEMPMPYFAATLLPFAPFVLLPARIAFLLWSLISVSLIAFSLWRLASAAGAKVWPFWLWALGSPMVYIGLGAGQVNALLLLGLSETVLAHLRGQEWRAGVWLSLMLVKPQFLPLFLVALAWKRQWRPIGAVCLGAVLFLLAAALLVSPGGLAQQISLLLNLAGNSQTTAGVAMAETAIVAMVNWRSVLSLFLSSESQSWWALLAVASVGTSAAGLWPWIRRARTDALPQALPFLGLTSAALLIGYVTHLPSLLLLAVPGVLLLGSKASEAIERGRWLIPLLETTFLLPSLIAGLVLITTRDPRLVVAGLGISQVLFVLLLALCGATAFMGGTSPSVPVSNAERARNWNTNPGNA